MILDLLTQYTVKSSTDQNQATLENMFLEEEQKTPLRQDPRAYIQDEYQLTAYPTFGLTTFSTTGESNVRALYNHNETLYAVAGNKFGSVNSGGTFSQLGSNLNTSSGYAKIVSITGGSNTNNQLVIIDGTNGYSYNTGSSTGEFPIADSDFPDTASDITTLDDYVIVLQNSSISYQLNTVSDSLTWSALDFASKTRKPDKIVGIHVVGGELMLLGNTTGEVWINTGNVSFPLERRPDVFIEQGLAAKRSLVVVAGVLMYLGQSRTGGYGIVQVENYIPKVVSTKAIMNLINSFSTVSDAIAYGYAKDGNEFYEITFPTADKTLTLNVSNGSWTIRNSNISGTYGRFKADCAAFCYGKCLIGDSQSGVIFTQDNAVYTENGTAIRRRFVTPNIYLEGMYFTINYLQIDVQSNVGSSKTFLLEMSLDRGNTWSTVGTYTVPTAGDNRIRIDALGGSNVFTFRITTTDNYKFVIRGFLADVTVGAW